MTEAAGIARLWQKFHHLSEDDKEMILTVTEAVGYFEQTSQTSQVLPEQVGELCGSGLREKREGTSNCV